MNYETWLEYIDILNKGQIDNKTLEILKNEEINSNINNLLLPKLEKLIKNRFEISISKIINNLGEIFSDINYLDLILVNFKKEINFILELINLKQINPLKKEELTKILKEKTNKTYDILLEKALNIDSKGIFYQIIINNRFKWSD